LIPTFREILAGWGQIADLKSTQSGLTGFESVRMYYESELLLEGKRNLNGEYRIPQ
jgi:hypothetical protein